MSSTTEITKSTSTTSDKYKPNMYIVIFHNDDKTTVDFVVAVLVTIFLKDVNEALAITEEVHFSGMGIAGTYPREVAESKCHEATELARANGFPLKVTFEALN